MKDKLSVRSSMGVLAIAIGIALLLPCIYAMFGRPSRLERAAFKPVFRIKLEELAKRQPVTRQIVLPSRSDIGAVDLSYRYIVITAVSERVAHCWKDLGIDITVNTVDRAVPVQEAEGAPYNWSSQCNVSGVWFPATGGERVTVMIRTGPSSELPSGELLLLPFWQSEAKDRMVGVMLHASITKLSWFTTPLAVALICFGVFLCRR